jgi:GTPase SAR1 family protein
VSSRNPARVILLGLDAAGKTTILYKFLRARETIDTFPTVGFNVEQITYRHLPMMLWDFGGQMIVRYT